MAFTGRTGRHMRGSIGPCIRGDGDPSLGGAGGIIPCAAGAGRRGSALAEDLGFAATSDFVEDSVVDLVSVVPLGSAAVEGLVMEVDSATAVSMALATVEVVLEGADIGKPENVARSENTKHQTPAKLQVSSSNPVWSLSFGVSLVFGFWSLVFRVCDRR
jgi:hypothetical protein